MVYRGLVFRLVRTNKSMKTHCKYGHLRSANRVGKDHGCALCRKARSAAYRKAHFEQLKIYQATYRKDHPAQAKIYRITYRKTHSKQLAERAVDYYTKHPEQIKARNTVYRKEHPEQIKAYGIAFRKENPERIKAYHLSNKYKLTLQEYKDFWFRQNGCCPCGFIFAEIPGQTPHIDHDHACCPGGKSCGKCVRGLLCRICNFVLGVYKEDLQLLPPHLVTYLMLYQNKSK